MKNKPKYDELSRAKVAQSRNVVISKCSKGGFTIAQQLEVAEGETATQVFMKGALHIDDITSLYNFRDAINVAIHKAENPDSEDNEDWDED